MNKTQSIAFFFTFFIIATGTLFLSQAQPHNSLSHNLLVIAFILAGFGVAKMTWNLCDK